MALEAAHKGKHFFLEHMRQIQSLSQSLMIYCMGKSEKCFMIPWKLLCEAEFAKLYTADET